MFLGQALRTMTGTDMSNTPQLRGVTWDDGKRNRLRPAAVGFLATCLLGAGLGIAPAASAATTSVAGPADAVVVRALPGQADRAADAVRAAGGTVERQLGALDTVTGTVPASSLAALRGAAGVAAVTADGSVALQGAKGGFDVKANGNSKRYDAKVDGNSVYSSLFAMGAQKYYGNGYTGKGVDVAVLDSGVSPVPGLDAPGKVVKGPDLTEESAAPSVAGLDTNGHGTFLAGLIAGRSADFTGFAKTDGSDTFVGAAPDARIVSVKAADAVGATDVSQVLAGIDWVVQHKNDNGMNIRVLNLSFGTDSDQTYLVDPLTYAVEVAWRHGIFVVVSAGNKGTELASLTSPATDPYVMAVGSEDTKDTMNRADDTIPSFSSNGTLSRSPDVVAPGKSVTSLRVPGSFIDQQHPTARVGDTLFRGSGTSQAAAYVSGVAALVLQQRPGITPDQLKELLTSTAQKLPSADSKAQGKGGINLSSAYGRRTNTLAVQAFPRATGLGSLEGARGSGHLTLGDSTLSGEQDLMGRPFDSAAWTRASEAGTTWDGDTWNGGSFGGSFAGGDWSSVGWSSVGWSSVGWSSVGWSSIGWSSVGWSSVGWSSVGWSSVGWSSVGWSSIGWSSIGWSSVGWA
jgi:serine protease AprX